MTLAFPGTKLELGSIVGVPSYRQLALAAISRHELYVGKLEGCLKMTRWILTTFLFLAGMASVNAAPLQLNQSGTFNSNSTLNGVAFGSPTDFTFSAVFDSTTDFDQTTAMDCFLLR